VGFYLLMRCFHAPLALVGYEPGFPFMCAAIFLCRPRWLKRALQTCKDDIPNKNVKNPIIHSSRKGEGRSGWKVEGAFWKHTHASFHLEPLVAEMIPTLAGYYRKR
jgi:hypothetical protein